ncbi:TPA: hypothetical protein DEG21_02610 [Patescibacteria group bacterium]|nr:hypothetical protein [Candidatus Gracilibacteria bacterium]HBY74767.1 hypothetical protein [Candidatus Gracilibacteria bacterium]
MRISSDCISIINFVVSSIDSAVDHGKSIIQLVLTRNQIFLVFSIIFIIFSFGIYLFIDFNIVSDPDSTP